jgi:hypothetical protein
MNWPDIPHRYGVSHGVVAALVVTAGALVGMAWPAAVFVIGFYYGREVAQDERIRRKMGPASLAPWNWSLDGQMDFYVPAIVSIGLAALAGYLEAEGWGLQ